ncbi:hypothetical protein HKCCE2091_21380 [Rhodobacterales bacterium HKCCE2091]|nr:hypothetical protein [Rhodobacterales bacterium HKCCE2091]
MIFSRNFKAFAIALPMALGACDMMGGMMSGGGGGAATPGLVSNLVLVPGGMQQPGNPAVIAFGNDEPSIIQLMVQITGNPPDSIQENPECGAGAMRFAAFPGGVTLNFLGGDFVGWTTRDPSVPVEGGLRPGLPAPDAADVTYSSTTLGTEFDQGDGIFGILTADGSEIDMMWAGTTCFFR